jgi:CubicO group peptidase (beta-lactamase class C family)
MKKILFLLFILCFSFNVGQSQSIYFPPTVGNQWDSLSINSLGWCQDKLDTLLDFLGNRNTKAFMLLKDGKIVVEKYYGTFTMDSLWYWASAGKTLTAFATGIAQQDGYLSIQDTSSTYLGQGWTIAPTAKENMITIRHQLTMTSGLNDGVPDHFCTIDTCLEYLTDAGTRWAYHNGPYTLLDSVLEVATGQPLNTYFNQKVKIPTGMTGMFVKSGFNNLFISKARSMARFGLLILNKGAWNTTPIMTDTTYFHTMTNTSQLLNPSYGYLWWLNGKSSYMVPSSQFVFNGPLNPNAPTDMIAALGKNGQFLNVVPSQQLVWLRMGDAPSGGDVPFTLNDTIWQKLNQVMCNPNGISSTISTNPSVQVIPNPCNDFIKIESNLPSYSIQLNDITGRLILKQDYAFKQTIISTTDLPEGIYLIRIIDKNRSISVHKINIRH